ncbi:MAG: short-chain dehydrogenase [Spirochaetae bacterium HGW-Spirochaetae-1]|jgi:2-deoxy-D-gluconate 3-dehydrogenase|nr:MAG: short-chain dehydrogenase [Spirochaetae bacterium HGW-Spirochaetae-1]
MSTINYNIKGKTALVTGGSKGIGLELARNLLEQGVKVAICGRKQENLDAAVAQLGGGDSILAVQAHIAKEGDVNRLFEKVMEEFGRLDILVNNVGMNLVTPSIAETEPSLWQKIIESNLSGTYMVSRKAAAIMKEQKTGKIISISSIAGHRAAPGMGIYGIAKAGIEMMTKVLATELAFFNVQVNAVAPAMIRTEFSKPFWSNEDIYREITRSIPMGRIGEPIEVVHPVLFLASEGSGFITGQTIMVDGGSTAR